MSLGNRHGGYLNDPIMTYLLMCDYVAISTYVAMYVDVKVTN